MTNKRLMSQQAFNITHQEYLNVRNSAYKSGIALKRHTETAHQSKIDQSCPACRELLNKALASK